MKKSLHILFILLIIILLISSFPIKYILGYQLISDIIRVVGFVMLIFYIIFIKNIKGTCSQLLYLQIVRRRRQ